MFGLLHYRFADINDTLQHRSHFYVILNIYSLEPVLVQLSVISSTCVFGSKSHLTYIVLNVLNGDQNISTVFGNINYPGSAQRLKSRVICHRGPDCYHIKLVSLDNKYQQMVSRKAFRPRFSVKLCDLAPDRLQTTTFFLCPITCSIKIFSHNDCNFTLRNKFTFIIVFPLTQRVSY